MSDTRSTELDDRIAALEGQLLAAECVINALVLRLPNQAGVVLQVLHATEVLAYGDALADAGASHAKVDAFRRQTKRAFALLDCKDRFAELATAAALVAPG